MGSEMCIRDSSKHYPDAEVDYLGIDLSAEMIRLANTLWGHRKQTNFIVANASPRIADYSIASGIFHVKLEQTKDHWEQFVRKTLDDLSATSRHGFAVNFLLPDANEPEVLQLYRTRPEPWSRYCESEPDAIVEVISNYGLPEFTLAVLKRSSAI